jgi:Xaa-Pro aminopeptidase
MTQPRSDLGQYAHGQFRVDYEDRPDHAALRLKRIARAREAMDAAGVDALLVWKNENVRYLTSLRAQIIAGKSAVLNGCLLVRDHDPILLCSGGEIERVKLVMTWIEEAYAVPIMEASGLVRGMVESTLKPLFDRLRLGSARVGVDECGFALIQAIGAQMPDVHLVDGDAVMHAARLIKFPEEIALMEEVAAIAEAVTQSAIDAVRPGVRETDVVAEAMHTLFRLGGEQAHVDTPFVASGEHMAPPNRIPSDKIIRDGDMVFIDIGAGWSGYWSDMGRTVFCGGHPARRQQEVYSAVYHALMAATAVMKPGNTNDDVARAVRTVAAEHGLAGRFISLFIGHGIGVGSNEPPYIGEDLPGAETVVLQENMTFAVEPLIWVPGVRGGAGVRLEDTIVVTPEGGRSLTRTSFDDRLLLP